jgi:hypothetical protein
MVKSAAVAIAVSLLGPNALVAAEPVLACPSELRMGNSEADKLFGGRAQAMLSLAAGEDWEANPELSALIVPDANFNLGSGDLGLGLGKGRLGARRLATALRADSYQFQVGSGIPYSVNVCDRHEKEVTFTRFGYAAKIKFTFLNGRIVSVSGWETTQEQGTIASVRGPSPQ